MRIFLFRLKTWMQRIHRSVTVFANLCLDSYIVTGYKSTIENCCHALEINTNSVPLTIKPLFVKMIEQKFLGEHCRKTTAKWIARLL